MTQQRFRINEPREDRIESKFEKIDNNKEMGYYIK